MRRYRNFLDRTDYEQRWIVDNTWCETCGKADLGMGSLQEYEEDGGIFVEGTCNGCGRIVRSEIVKKDVD